MWFSFGSWTAYDVLIAAGACWFWESGCSMASTFSAGKRERFPCVTIYHSSNHEETWFGAGEAMLLSTAEGPREPGGAIAATN